ncbi:hypothetical protein COCSUDRAFT_34067 [Coccomyxa subellipsoidea C-169]|uniref:Uncharacterized protein n=1 Tax=Coccomyxa subellipsoidea (strain C-169) TaxID=574566 RepID=I0YP71_COCSC|nr:hypothetical protein COCSUDRAFT_34067 [Coccomyxa subellipsoidea C-169]EIE20190.1 hypothetical protein COCSUDRAFT_34067 [Coccomyxa subellipsoidea C-169]|eukprot:XP_005644734.1 hypothetical protein COCSUDRAFT_34067 [Coccomyxa subellipsoidea C-169]
MNQRPPQLCSQQTPKQQKASPVQESAMAQVLNDSQLLSSNSGNNIMSGMIYAIQSTA